MLRYFFYLAWNWSFQLAVFIIRHEIRGEKKYGINTIGVDELNDLPKEKKAHASVYQPINYYTAETLFNELVLEDLQGALLDLGCGKGRIFGIGAAYGFKEIVGVDFLESLCTDAIQTAQKVATKYSDVKMKVVCQDASNYIIPDNTSTIFLFNPFDAVILEEVIKHINKSQQQNPRPIKILYANPVWKKVLEKEGFIETFYFQKMTYLEGSILEREAF
jgi:2-polyprenyl-3-methyl-5-hydroxy-6-metoxy-1,4-benzoquinol methylase